MFDNVKEKFDSKMENKYKKDILEHNEIFISIEIINEDGPIQTIVRINENYYKVFIETLKLMMNENDKIEISKIGLHSIRNPEMCNLQMIERSVLIKITRG